MDGWASRRGDVPCVGREPQSSWSKRIQSPFPPRVEAARGASRGRVDVEAARFRRVVGEVAFAGFFGLTGLNESLE